MVLLTKFSAILECLSVSINVFHIIYPYHCNVQNNPYFIYDIWPIRVLNSIEIAI